MSVRSKIGVAVVFSLAIFLLGRRLPAAGQGQKPVWKGKIETENGIKVIKNPKDPLYGEIKFDLQEDLSIGGNEKEDNYYFPKGVFIAVDDQRDIFATDLGNVRIQK